MPDRLRGPRDVRHPGQVPFPLSTVPGPPELPLFARGVDPQSPEAHRLPSNLPSGLAKTEDLPSPAGEERACEGDGHHNQHDQSDNRARPIHMHTFLLNCSTTSYRPLSGELKVHLSFLPSSSPAYVVANNDTTPSPNSRVTRWSQ
jgi:hypothetical protein